MTDYLSRMAARTLGLEPLIAPHLPSRFEPMVPAVPNQLDLETSGNINELRSIQRERAAQTWDNSLLATPSVTDPSSNPPDKQTELKIGVTGGDLKEFTRESTPTVAPSSFRPRQRIDNEQQTVENQSFLQVNDALRNASSGTSEQTPTTMHSEDTPTSIPVEASAFASVRPLSTLKSLRPLDKDLHPQGVYGTPRAAHAENGNKSEANIDLYQQSETKGKASTPASPTGVVPPLPKMDLEASLNRNQHSLYLNVPRRELEPQESGMQEHLPQNSRHTGLGRVDMPETTIMVPSEHDDISKTANPEPKLESKSPPVQPMIRRIEHLVQMDAQKRLAPQREDDFQADIFYQDPISSTHQTKLTRPKTRQHPDRKSTFDRRAEEDTATPIVHVNIGRIEVRAAPLVDTKPLRQHKKTPTLGLDEYLRHRDEGDRK